jgi:hypothetical protein
VADFAPTLVGAKRRLSAQVAAGASDPPQSWVKLNSAALVPASPIELMSSGTLPELVSVAVLATDVVAVATLPKERLAGARLATGVAAVTVMLTRAAGDSAPWLSTTWNVKLSDPLKPGAGV